MWQFVQHVLSTQYRLGSLLDQMVGAVTSRAGDVSGNSKHFPILLQRRPGRDEGAGILGSFGDQRAVAETADDSVPDGKVLGPGKAPSGELADDALLFPDTLVKPTVFTRIDDIHPAAQDRHREATPIERSNMPLGIDPPGQAADDAQSR